MGKFEDGLAAGIVLEVVIPATHIAAVENISDFEKCSNCSFAYSESAADTRIDTCVRGVSIGVARSRDGDGYRLPRVPALLI